MRRIRREQPRRVAIAADPARAAENKKKIISEKKRSAKRKAGLEANPVLDEGQEKKNGRQQTAPRNVESLPFLRSRRTERKKKCTRPR